MCIALLANMAMAQNAVPDSMRLNLAVITRVNQGNSYITFPTDLGNIEPLWFEANVAPSFYIRRSKNARLIGVLTSQFIIRMYREDSYPVRTPSYIPQITAYYMLKGQGGSRTLSLFGKLAHHSNGQDGDFYLENGDVNLISGSFSTNYFEVGMIHTNFIPRHNVNRFLKTSLEIHPSRWVLDNLEGQYATAWWRNAISFFKLPEETIGNGTKKVEISVKGEVNLILNDMNDWSPLSANRFNFKATFYYRPKIFEDIGLFVQYYHGADYYNIYFDHQLDILRFGLMTERINF